MNGYAVLTEEDRLILESYKSVLNGLAKLLGPGFEMVLHSLEDLDRSAIEVINGHLSGRREGAPITDFALEMLEKIKESANGRESLVYLNTSKTGAPLRSATIPIIGKDKQIIGLLCINFYMNLPLNEFLESMFMSVNESKNTVETFAGNTDELVSTSLESVSAKIRNDASISPSNKNKEIIYLLHQKGIFRLKDAVTIVAEYLGISRNTVYLHLRKLQNQD